MNEDHTDGRCYACGEDKPVRWKNLYTIGSEGTWLCMECEMKVVHLLRDLACASTRAKIERIKKERSKCLKTF